MIGRWDNVGVNIRYFPELIDLRHREWDRRFEKLTEMGGGQRFECPSRG